MTGARARVPPFGAAAAMRPCGGFTLIEMLVVMLLLGLVTSLALPSMQRWYDAVQARTQTMEIVEALRGAIFAAGVNRREILMDERSFVSAAAEAPAEPASAAASEPQMRPREVAVTQPPARAESDKVVKVTLPTGWQLDRVESAAFLPSGLCRAGSAELKTAAGAAVVIEVRGPLCTVAVRGAGERR